MEVEGKGGGDGSQLFRPLGAEGEQGPVAQVDPVEEAQGDHTFCLFHMSNSLQTYLFLCKTEELSLLS